MNRVHTTAPFTTSTTDRFRWRLQLTVMAMVSVATIVVMVVTQRRVEATTADAVRLEFQRSFDQLRGVQGFRHAAMVERCRGLVERLRVSTERDLRRRLYAHGAEVLADVLESAETVERTPEQERKFHVEFFRFLDADGEVIPPHPAPSMHSLTATEEWRLRLPGAPRDEPQLGCMIRDKPDKDGELFDLIALPVALARGQRYVATLVLGLESAQPPGGPAAGGALPRGGIWTQGRLFRTDFPAAERDEVANAVARVLAASPAPTRPIPATVGGVPCLMLMQCLNPGSSYPPVYEVGVYSLEQLQAQKWRLRWQVLGAGGAVLLLALGLTRAMAALFTRPVEQLVQVSVENRARRRDAEEALALTSEGLRRAARFSADASHQLKTPVAVMRAGLEELLAQESLSPRVRAELGQLIKQTERLSGLVDDLLLLSRMDAGRLEIQLTTIDLVQLAEAALDDLTARPDPFALRLTTELPSTLPVKGEARYVALLLGNLVENASKYNVSGGRIHVSAACRDGMAELRIANTARVPIPESAQLRLFDRFNRGAMGEDIPGYGLGLNLARELARLHGGDLLLMRSNAEWTEFALRLAVAD